MDYIAIGIELFSDTVMWETIFGGIIWRQRHKTSDAHEPNNFQKSFRKLKTKNKNPTYLPIFFRSIIWEPEFFFCMALIIYLYLYIWPTFEKPFLLFVGCHLVSDIFVSPAKHSSTLSRVCLSLCLSGNHIFFVVTHSYVSQATLASLGMLPQFSLKTLIMPLKCNSEAFRFCPVCVKKLTLDIASEP